MLKFCDSFDHYGSSDISRKYESLSSAATSTVGRNGTRGLYCTTTNEVGKYLGTPVGTVIVGFAFWWNSVGISNRAVLKIYDKNNAVACSLRFNISSQKIEFLLGNQASLVATGTTVFGIASAWRYIELKVDPDPSSGSYEVRVDGVTELSGSGIATSAASTDCLAVYLGPDSSNGGVFYMDDFYICDDQGGVNDDFLGDVTVEHVLPNADGTYGDFVGSTSGVDDYTLVDENPVSTTDYLRGTDVGDKVSVGLASLSGTDTVLGVQALASCNKESGGAAVVNVYVRAGGVDSSDGVDVGLSSTNRYASSCSDLSPATGLPFSISEVDAAEVVVEIV